MKQWEYMFVQIALARGFRESVYRIFAIDGEEVTDWQRGQLWHEFFVDKGAEGWEFVIFDETFLTDTVVGGKLAIFKREMGQPPAEQLPPPVNPFTTT